MPRLSIFRPPILDARHIIRQVRLGTEDGICRLVAATGGLKLPLPSLQVCRSTEKVRLSTAAEFRRQRLPTKVRRDSMIRLQESAVTGLPSLPFDLPAKDGPSLSLCPDVSMSKTQH
jgi:hypothetical protein